MVKITTNSKLIRPNYWLEAYDLKSLHQHKYCYMLINEWLCYEECEGYINALNFEITEVLIELDESLNLPHISKTIRDSINLLNSPNYNSIELHQLQQLFYLQKVQLQQTLDGYLNKSI